MKNFYLALVVIILSLSLVACNDPDCAELQAAYKETAAKVHKRVDETRVGDRITGITYAVHNDRCILFSGSSGSGNVEGTQVLDPARSLFRMASVSKLFTTLAASQLIERGELDLETNFMDLGHAPFVEKLNREETPERLARWRQVKVKHLMSHQAGFSKDLPGVFIFFNSFAIQDNAYPTMHEFYDNLTKVEFIYPAGQIPTGLKYSNLGMNMLARLVESYNRDGKSFTNYVKSKILRPLGMEHTHYDLAPEDRSYLTTGYGNLTASGRLTLPKVYYTGAYDGSIGVASSAEDLSRLGMEFLKLAYFDGSQILRDNDVIRNYLEPKSFLNKSIAWANGPMWQVLPGETVDAPLWIGHTGTGYGERTAMFVSPEKNLGVTILFNAADVNREKYVKMISDFIPTKNEGLGEDSLALLAKGREFLRATVPPVQNYPIDYPTRPELEKFVGTYFADVVGPQAVTISSEGYLTFFGNKLLVDNLAAGRFRFPKTAGTLFNSEPIQFSFDANGKPISFRAAQVKHLERRD